MKKLIIALGLIVGIQAHAESFDTCRDGIHAAQSFIKARDAGVSQAVVLASLQPVPDESIIKISLYRQVANWVYQNPEMNIDRLAKNYFGYCNIVIIEPL